MLAPHASVRTQAVDGSDQRYLGQLRAAPITWSNQLPGGDL